MLSAACGREGAAIVTRPGFLSGLGVPVPVPLGSNHRLRAAARLRAAGGAGGAPASSRVTTTVISVAVLVTVRISRVPDAIRICNGIGAGLAVSDWRNAAVRSA